MLSTNSNNYERIILTEKEFERKYDKHSVYNPENCCEDLINCCEARALESPEANKVESSKQKAT